MKHVALGLVFWLLALTTAQAADVTQFGAVPNDGKDDTEAFLAAFGELRAKGDKLLVIPQGRYDLRADGNPEHRGALFPLARIDGLTIRGQGAELMMRGIATVFAFNQCSNLTLEGLTLDWERPPFSQGTVIASEPKFFDVQIENGFPLRGGEPVGAYMSYDPATRLPSGKNMDVYDAVERTELLRPQVLRVHQKRPISVPVGTLLVLRHQVYGPGPAIWFHRCTDAAVHDITVYTAPGMALVGSVCTNVSLKRFNVLNRPGSGRLMSATADATHFGGCRGTVSLEDCTFEGMGDDGVNVKSGLYLTVRQRLDDHSLLAQHNLKMSDVPDAGDVMEMSHTDTLLPFASGTVKTAVLEPGEERLHRVTFAEPLPGELHEGDVLGNASRTPKLRMQRCTVQANRARGVLCQTRDAVIENCTFRRCTGPGVLVLTEVTHFHESIGTRNVIVRNCLFENCNLGTAATEAPLCALAWLKNFAYPPAPGVHRDVRFEGNRIVGDGPSAIFAVGVDGLTIRGNTFERTAASRPEPGAAPPFRVMNCARVEMAGNRVEAVKMGNLSK